VNFLHDKNVHFHVVPLFNQRFSELVMRYLAAWQKREHRDDLMAWEVYDDEGCLKLKATVVSCQN
jgi:hypothetical protein